MAKLHQAADAFVKVREELKTLSSADPEVTRLRSEAEQQLALGAFEAARAKLDRGCRRSTAGRDRC